MNIVLVASSELDSSGRVILRDGRGRHLTTVLRVSKGQPVRMGVLNGPFGIGIVERVDDGAVELRCALERDLPPVPPVDLLIALPRPKVMRRLWAQLAAIGVGRIVVTNAGRVERHYFDTHVLTPACYEPLLIEGLQQARDTRVPVVSIHRRFRPLIEDELGTLCPDAMRLVAHPGAAHTIADTVAGARHRRILLALGPEGGWSSFELDLLRAHNFVAISAGDRTLRSDTAAVALLAIVHDAWRGADRRDADEDPPPHSNGRPLVTNPQRPAL